MTGYDSIIPDPYREGRAKILVADDDALQRHIYTDLIEEIGHECLCVENGTEALEKIRSFRPDLIILDVVMPGLDGFEVTKRLKQDPSTAHIPVIIVTMLSDRGSRLRGLKYGADDLLGKPVDPVELVVRINNLLKVKRFGDYLMDHGRMLEGEVISKTLELEKAYKEIRHGYIETVYRLTLAAEYRDRETGTHIKRISLYSQMLARFLGLEEAKVEAIFFASPMHDVGKIGIPDSVLLKSGRLTEKEYNIMKRHTVIGARILAGSDSEILKTACEIAKSHHERWDGTGYPEGLCDEDIPVSARIVHICDIYDALRSVRPYKAPLSHEDTCRRINKIKERFDPEIIKAFNECHGEFKRIFDENRDEDGIEQELLSLRIPD